jgi:hypothetical protein
MFIYGGSRATVLKQLECMHQLIVPCIDSKFRYFKCSKCYAMDVDVKSEKEYFDILNERLVNK